MDKAKLKSEAEKAIDAAKTNPFSVALGLVPVVQVKTLHLVTNWPFKYKLVGMVGDHFVYNLDAEGVIKSLNYEELEFNL